MESILTSIKKLLGIEDDYTAFDTDIIININSVFMTLNQLGVGPKSGFSISGKETSWSAYLGDSKLVEGVKMYVYLKVRLAFDPPNHAFVIESINKQIAELEWRLTVQAESPQALEETVISFEEIDEMFEN